MSFEADKIFPDKVAWYPLETEVSAENLSVMARGSILNVRRIGGFIAYGVLRDPTSGIHTEVFYSDLDMASPKPDASFTMSPVGKNGGLGGQHGLYRLVSHDQVESRIGLGIPSLVTRAELPPYLPQLTTRYELGQSSLKVDTILWPGNSAKHQIETSLGQHNDYFAEGENLDQLRINNESLDDLLNESGATEAIIDGKPRLWQNFGSDFEGVADVVLPGGRWLHITAETGYTSVNESLGMLIWRRKGKDLLELGPVLGVEKVGSSNRPEDFNNRAFHLGEGVFEHGALLSVTTELRVA